MFNLNIETDLSSSNLYQDDKLYDKLYILELQHVYETMTTINYWFILFHF